MAAKFFSAPSSPGHSQASYSRQSLTGAGLTAVFGGDGDCDSTAAAVSVAAEEAATAITPPVEPVTKWVDASESVVHPSSEEDRQLATTWQDVAGFWRVLGALQLMLRWWVVPLSLSLLHQIRTYWIQHITRAVRRWIRNLKRLEMGRFAQMWSTLLQTAASQQQQLLQLGVLTDLRLWVE